jgi:competence protein ComEC
MIVYQIMKLQGKILEFLEKNLKKILRKIWYNKKMPVRDKLSILLIIILALGTFLLFSYIQTENNREFLTVAFLDVGQGDAIFIESPNGNQLLIDSGPTASVVRRLSDVMPFYDRSINTILATHHDADHTAAFPEILKRYKIDQYITSTKDDNDSLFFEIEKLVKNEPADRIVAVAGDKIILDEERNIYIEILWPPADVEIEENNDASIVTRLVYGEIAFMLTGDAPQSVEEKIVATEHEIESEILKAGHHGSRTSSANSFVELVNPEYAIISAGKDNKFGHPHSEVIEIFEKQEKEIQILSTAELGNIIFQSDGAEVWLLK